MKFFSSTLSSAGSSSSSTSSSRSGRPSDRASSSCVRKYLWLRAVTCGGKTLLLHTATLEVWQAAARQVHYMAATWLQHQLAGTIRNGQTQLPPPPVLWQAQLADFCQRAICMFGYSLLLYIDSPILYYAVGFTFVPHLQLSVFLPVFNPSLALALRVNQQRVARGLGHNDTILNGQVIIGQALQVPLFCLQKQLFHC